MKQKYWGLEIQVDLKKCDPSKIRDKKVIEEFVIKLCSLIKMRRFGDPVIVNFGAEERVAGYSMFQLIETSNVSAHFANKTNNVYLNVFSCKEFDPLLVETFASNYFEARSSKSKVSKRR